MIAALAAPATRRQPPASVPDPAAVDRLLEMAFTTFKDGYLASQVAAMMRARTSDQVVIEQINRREVAAHRAEAAASAGLARQAHLAEAVEIARARRSGRGPGCGRRSRGCRSPARRRARTWMGSGGPRSSSGTPQRVGSGRCCAR
jgi:hypothetical protein